MPTVLLGVAAVVQVGWVVRDALVSGVTNPLKVGTRVGLSDPYKRAGLGAVIVTTARVMVA